jgi:teichoic acid transport system permease protein
VTTTLPDRTRGPDPAAAALAVSWGLERVGRRPPLRVYVKEAWRRRHFATALAKSRVIASSAENRLGLLWELLNPILLACVYYLAFGVLLNTKKDNPDFEGFLLCGVLSWYFLNRSIRQGASSITGNRNLIRSLHFPRVILPISIVLRQFIAFYSNFLVIVVVVLIKGEGIRWQWVEGPLCLVLMACFGSGAAMIAAWATSRWRDIDALLPFVLRMWMYFAGIFFSVHVRYKNAPHVIQVLAYYNPAAVYLQIMRHAFLKSVVIDELTIVWAVIWAVLFLAVGTVVFWRAEERYGDV